MRVRTLRNEFEETRSEFPYLTLENFDRIQLLYYGVSYKNQVSYPDPFTRIELLYTPESITDFPIMTFYRPDSPFMLADTGTTSKRVLLYQGELAAKVSDFEARVFDMRKEEPFYFFVREVNGDLVLKLNPIQLCDFFQNPRGMMPCSFCFRNDMVNRFRNSKAQELVNMIRKEEKDKDNFQTLKLVDEISIVTGSYKNDDEYLREMELLVKGVRKLIGREVRVVAGSHEGKGREVYRRLRECGVTVYAFPVESMDPNIRIQGMKNRKGVVPIGELIENINDAIQVFGSDGVIVRLVAGMGDELNSEWENTVRELRD